VVKIQPNRTFLNVHIEQSHETDYGHGNLSLFMNEATANFYLRAAAFICFA